MKFLPVVLFSAMACLAAPILHLVSGEEIEADVLSLREKQVAVGKGDSVTHLIPYDRIAAIRMEGKLHTEGLDRTGLAKLFPALAPVAPDADASRPGPGGGAPGWEFKAAPAVSHEGHFLTFQGLASLPAFRPVVALNYEWTTRLPIHFTTSLVFEAGGIPADTAFHGEKIGVGGKAGIRRYFQGKRGWYGEGDVGGFHFFNGMQGGDRSYFGTGPFLGYRTLIEKVALDANIGWMHVFNEPEVFPDLPLTGEEWLDRPLGIQKASAEIALRNLYPLMRFEANFALGFKL